MKDYQLDGNKEMVALGAMNVVGSFTSCYVATGKFKYMFYKPSYLLPSGAVRSIDVISANERNYNSFVLAAISI